MTILLWISSGAVIGLLSVFSAQNKKAGWKKSRTNLGEALVEFYSDLGLLEAPQEPAPFRGTSPVIQATDAEEFSRQLINLNGALGEPSKVMEESMNSRQTGLVHVQSR